MLKSLLLGVYQAISLEEDLHSCGMCPLASFLALAVSFCLEVEIEFIGGD
jgi:hypothetical protein